MLTTIDRPIVVDIVNEDLDGHAYVHGVGTDGNRIMHVSKSGRRWSVELPESGAGSLHAGSLAVLALALSWYYRVSGIAVVNNELTGVSDEHPVGPEICGYCDQPATRVSSNEPLCQACARNDMGSEWRECTTKLTPAKVARYRRTGCYEGA